MQGATAQFLIALPGQTILVQEGAKDLYMAIGEEARAATRQLEKTKEARRQGVSRGVAWAQVEIRG